MAASVSCDVPAAADRPRGIFSTKSGETVRLSVGTWITVISLLATQFIALGGYGISMWTRVAVLESKLAQQEHTLQSLESKIERLLERP